MKKHYLSLYKYNNWCNEQLIALIAKHPKAYSKRAQTLMGHILNAHHIWNCRIQKIERSYNVWDTFEITELGQINQTNFETSVGILENSDYEYLLRFVNTLGETHIKRIKDILFHIVNHSTYHRGQLMTELISNGAPAIVLDYTFYKK